MIGQMTKSNHSLFALCLIKDLRGFGVRSVTPVRIGSSLQRIRYITKLRSPLLVIDAHAEGIEAKQTKGGSVNYPKAEKTV
jgi:hypothetical protein